MAIWQYDMYAFPQATLQATLGQIPPTLTLEDSDRFDLWRDTDLSSLISKLDDVLPRVAGWDSSLLVWGADSGDRIDLSLSDDQKIESVFIRVNLYRRTRGFVNRLLALALAEEWLLLGEQSNRLFPPDSEALLADLRRSDAARFVIDPEKFIKGLSDEETE